MTWIVLGCIVTVTAGLLLLARGASAQSKPPEATSARKAPAGAPAAAALKECLKKADQPQCLDRLFRQFLTSHSTADALAVVQGFEASDPELRLACHPIVHAIGRETFRLKKTIHESFAACDQTCHSGCYHGAVERFLLGPGDDTVAGHVSIEDLKKKVVEVCDPRIAVRYRFQCLHGLGHALMFFSGYRLVTALDACDQLLDTWSQSSCYGGVFMENVFSATPEKRDVSPTNYHYPCDRVAGKYRSECYIIQTWRMSEMGLSTEGLFDECRKAGPYRSRCMQSIGRDLSNDARVKDPRLAAQQCEMGDRGEDRQACIRGVVYALIDNTWDGRYAFPFCATFARSDDVRYCFARSAEYLRTTFEKSGETLRGECRQYVTRPESCLEAVAVLR